MVEQGRKQIPPKFDVERKVNVLRACVMIAQDNLSYTYTNLAQYLLSTLSDTKAVPGSPYVGRRVEWSRVEGININNV